MGTEDVILLVTSLVLAAGSVGIGVVVRNRRQRPAPLVTGIGVAAMLVGGWLSGLTALLWHGIVGVVNWAVGVPDDVLSLIGAIVLGLGLVTVVIGGVVANRQPPATSTALPPSTSSKRSRKKDRKNKSPESSAEEKPRGITPAGSGVARVPGMTSTPAPAPAPVSRPTSPDPSPLEISEPPRGAGSNPTASGNLPPTLP